MGGTALHHKTVPPAVAPPWAPGASLRAPCRGSTSGRAGREDQEGDGRSVIQGAHVSPRDTAALHVGVTLAGVFRRRVVEVQVFRNGPDRYGWIASNRRLGMLGSSTRRYGTRHEVLDDWLRLEEVVRDMFAAEDSSRFQFDDTPLGGIDWTIIDGEGQSVAESGVPSNNLNDAGRRANALIFAVAADKWKFADEAQWEDQP